MFYVCVVLQTPSLSTYFFLLYLFIYLRNYFLPILNKNIDRLIYLTWESKTMAKMGICPFCQNFLIKCLMSETI